MRFSWTTVQLLAPRAHQTMLGEEGNDMHPAVAMLLSMATITMMGMLLWALTGSVLSGRPTYIAESDQAHIGANYVHPRPREAGGAGNSSAH